MLPPVLEIYVVRHPGDAQGAEIAASLVDHFHGNLFSGLLGGAIEVYVRSQSWLGRNDAPRPLPLAGTTLPSGMLPAKFVAVVPVLGNEMAFAAGDDASPWRAYLQALVEAEAASEGRLGVFPVQVDADATGGTALGALFGRYQQLARPDPAAPPEPVDELRCRDLAQALTQLLGDPPGQPRVTVFISHTKRATEAEEREVATLITTFRSIIANTRLAAFFDANDLQPGENWDRRLRQEAGHGALLALRTDLYASREWCQREMNIAKQEGMPIVILDALTRGEERGSFLLDHAPRVPVHLDEGGWRLADIRRGLNLLVDECLKRALWRHQKELARGDAGLAVSWWAPHAPEPVTLAHWLAHAGAAARTPSALSGLLVLHPDPPLTREECDALDQLAGLAGVLVRLDVLTPRTLAARGGGGSSKPGNRG